MTPQVGRRDDELVGACIDSDAKVIAWVVAPVHRPTKSWADRLAPNPAGRFAPGLHVSC